MNREELEQLTIKQLKAKCKELGLKGYGRKPEDELIDIILSNASEDDKVTEDETKKAESSMVTFRKLIKGAFGFNGNTFKGSTFELSEEDANHPKIKNAIKGGLIEIK